MDSIWMNLYVYTGEKQHPTIKEIEKKCKLLFGGTQDTIPRKGDYYKEYDEKYNPIYYEVIAVIFASSERPNRGVFAEGLHTELTNVDIFLKPLTNE